MIIVICTASCCQCCALSDAEQRRGSRDVAVDTARSQELMEEFRCSKCRHFHSPRPSSAVASSEDDDDDVVMININDDDVALKADQESSQQTEGLDVPKSDTETAAASEIVDGLKCDEELVKLDDDSPVSIAEEAVEKVRSPSSKASESAEVTSQDAVDKNLIEASSDDMSKQLSAVSILNTKKSNNIVNSVEDEEVCKATTSNPDVHPLPRHATDIDPLQCPDVQFVLPKSNKDTERIVRTSSLDSGTGEGMDVSVQSDNKIDQNCDTIPRTKNNQRKKPGTAVRVGGSSVTPQPSTSKLGRISPKRSPNVKGLKCFKGVKVTYKDLPLDEDEVHPNDSDEETGETSNEDGLNKSLPMDPLLKKMRSTVKRKISMPYKITPEGVNVNFISDISK